VDWKPEWAVQAKVMDWKETKRKEAWRLKCVIKITLYASLQMATSSRLLTMGFLPRRHQLLPCAGFHLVNGSICSQWYHLQERLPNVGTAMLVHFQSYLSCLVSSSHLSYTIYTVIHHAFIHTLILSYIHTFMHTHHIHNINSYMVASVTQSLVWLYPFSSVLTHHYVK